MAALATQCRKWDVPLLGVIGLGKTNEDKKKDPELKSLLGSAQPPELHESVLEVFLCPESQPVFVKISA